ncbi:uncharacterized protein LOC121571250 isoform X2 [Coregonus clupeaformis]|uniref:uncharacterized protein LOC121571250 isoform X2 n=1 Tax=Coregonus clupeaformis TaxID=59861 RepID=UPI001BE08855|nr:uncharacterized protein LOC121571250 isoform X2 [Coregonus clupeaformis]
MPEPSEMSGPEVAKTPGGGAPGKEGMEAVANGHAGEGEQGGDDPFAEYMWMENEDAYNRQVEEELLEQEFLERCFQEMLDEEDQDWFIPARDLPSGMGQIQQQLNGLSVSDRGNAEEMAIRKVINGLKERSLETQEETNQVVDRGTHGWPASIWGEMPSLKNMKLVQTHRQKNYLAWPLYLHPSPNSSSLTATTESCSSSMTVDPGQTEFSSSQPHMQLGVPVQLLSTGLQMEHSRQPLLCLASCTPFTGCRRGTWFQQS